jgi:hypothetical protein
MSVHLSDGSIAGTPPEPALLKAVTVRLLEDACERERFDEELAAKHYLKNANAVGRVLRYVAEYRGQWVALLVFSSAAFHIKPRDRWLQWSARQVAQRRHLIAQNARFLVLAAPGKWPNLASRVLKVACARLPQDWQQRFGYPVLALEIFVDPQRFHGTCYKAAGCQQLGATQGSERSGQDFYTDTEHPKELWVRPLSPTALEQLRAPELPPAPADPKGPLPPVCPVAFPPQASTLDKDHGRIESRQPWSASTDPKAIGLAGVAQVVRIHCHTQEVRQGKIIKETDDARFALTSFWREEAGPQRLLERGRPAPGFAGS